MSSPSFFSQAGNFASAVSGGVDPRTGLFNVQITLGHLVGNRNLGPTLPLELSYSPLNWTNSGFGQGFSLGLTVYDTDAHLLSLASGDQYKAEDVPEKKKVNLFQNPLVTACMTMEDTSYKIVHKSGDVEILTGPKNGYALKVPTALVTPAGRRLELEWIYKGSQPRLSKISDENEPLLTVDYSDQAKSILTILPGQSEAFDVELWFSDDRLTHVRHHGPGSEEVLDWGFTYGDMGQTWGSWITAVSMPGGMSESATYDPTGHKFPTKADLPDLPYVTELVQVPGCDQPAVRKTYTYSDDNFVGGHSGMDWSAQEDYLYGTASDYTYWSIESRPCGDQTAHVKRTYSNYHLLTDETEWQNSCSRTTHTDYHVDPGKPFDKQPPPFQLPRTRTVTWSEPDPQKPGSTKTRPEVTETVFDDQGNPVSRKDPDGTLTEWAFYPASGSEDEAHKDCPPDPNGFTRLLKSVTRTPPDTGFSAPVYVTTYTYEAASTKESRVPIVVLKSKESHQGGGALLNERTYSHETSDAKEFGRITGMVETEYPDGSSGTSYETTHTFTFSVTGDALQQSHSLTVDDKAEKLTVTRSQTRSRFTGRLRSAKDPQDNETAMTYDNLGRLVERTANPGTPHAATQTHHYAIGPGGKGFVVTSTDTRGNQVRDTLDGAGRAVKAERLDIDAIGDGDWYTLKTIGYDEQGRTATTTTFDRTRDGTAAELGQTFAYDDWGQPLTVERTDGPTHLTRGDPVEQTVTTQMLHDGTEATGTQVTTRDLRLRPVSIERFARDSAHTPRGKRTMEYDGWGRLRRATDELGNRTLHDYDVRGRLTLTTLPDGTTHPEGTKIGRSYAPFSAQPLATDVSVDGTSYGTQTFDALGRRTSTTAGQRTWSYTYAQDADPRPAGVTAPDGQASSYRYEIELGNALTEVSTAPITQTFTRDPATGALTEAVEGTVTRTRDYYPSGLVSADTTKTGTNTLTTKASYTVAGLEGSYTAVDGVVQKTTRDEYGRIAALVDGDDAQTIVDYDDTGRVSGWTATDTTGHKLTTELALDDFGREVKRTITDDNSTSWTLTQEWNDNDTLSRRTLTRGTTELRDEKFTYDGRNRLTAYSCAGTAPPKDHRGNTVTAQAFTYDAYANVTTCTTTFSSGSDTATYHFSATDPCQLTRIEHTHADYPNATLSYDKAGRLTTDDTGRTLTYDALGRLRTAGSDSATSSYGYDPLDRLLTQTTRAATTVLSYRSGTLAAVTGDSTGIRLLQLGWACTAQHRTDGSQQTDTRLLGTDAQRTVLLATGSNQPEEYAYTPYGDRPAEAAASILGYTGERTDPDLGWLHLGNGYRPYHPGLMRFTAPDSLSPFGPGGINPYTYCAGDPVNHTDPSGHLSWGAWLGIGLGVLGLAAAAFTGGASIVAAGGLIAALESASATSLVFGALAATADITAISGGALEKASPKASSVLGWVSLGTGLAALGGLASIGRATEGIEVATEARAVATEATDAATETATAAELPTGVRGDASLARWYYAQYGENTFGAGETGLRTSPNFALPEGRMYSEEIYSPPTGSDWSTLKARVRSAVYELNSNRTPMQRGRLRMAAGMQIGDDIFVGTSGGPEVAGSTNFTAPRFSALKAITENLEADSASGWRCAEIHCMERALDAGYTIEDFRGARMVAMYPMWRSSTFNRLARVVEEWREPCHADKHLLGHLGILW
ncbi:RHS repeat-associated core domain-containing protein [Kitasatospora sp. NPDC005856]|uniref:RHS repeat domain-containing protein n=1 Tax=Kitasatospora sp. NPDC005856 TaxID=3154566 RepID=UPI0033ED1CC8